MTEQKVENGHSLNMTNGKVDTLKTDTLIKGVGVAVGAAIVLKLADALIKKIH